MLRKCKYCSGKAVYLVKAVYSETNNRRSGLVSCMCDKCYERSVFWQFTKYRQRTSRRFAKCLNCKNSLPDVRYVVYAPDINPNKRTNTKWGYAIGSFCPDCFNELALKELEFNPTAVRERENYRAWVKKKHYKRIVDKCEQSLNSSPENKEVVM